MSGFRTWWAKRWPRTLEPLGLVYPDNRIVRGRRLARDVDDMIVSPGEITAWVDQPRRTFGVTITVTAFTDAQWANAFGAMAARPHSLADLIDDRLPENVDRALAEVGPSLFPEDGELSAECPCSDRSAACAHVIAVHHAFAERFEDDPFLLPLLRGLERRPLLDGVRSAMTATAPPPSGPAVAMPLASVDPAAFLTGDRELLTAWR